VNSNNASDRWGYPDSNSGRGTEQQSSSTARGKEYLTTQVEIQERKQSNEDSFNEWGTALLGFLFGPFAAFWVLGKYQEWEDAGRVGERPQLWSYLFGGLVVAFILVAIVAYASIHSALTATDSVVSPYSVP
jgi:hypothetical protein